MLYGIFGYPIGHSLSPLMHNTAFAHYGSRQSISHLPYIQPVIEIAVKSIAALQMGGVNVTIPHKQAVLAWMDELSPEARLIGAVNTIHLRNGRLHGYNTDGIGFLRASKRRGAKKWPPDRHAVGGWRSGASHRRAAVPVGRSSLLLANRTRLVPRSLPPSLSKISPMPISALSPWGNHP